MITSVIAASMPNLLPAGIVDQACSYMKMECATVQWIRYLKRYVMDLSWARFI